MLFHVIESERSDSDRKDASIKPRRDIILTAERAFSSQELKCEFSSLQKNASLLSKIAYQFVTYPVWKKAISRLKLDDSLLVNYPPVYGCFSFGHAVKKRKCKIILFLHDLEALRGGDSFASIIFKIIVKHEEKLALNNCDFVISHNSKMTKEITKVYGIPSNKVIDLQIFDYLISCEKKTNKATLANPVIIAGNLNPNKAGYLSFLPKDVEFNLYGPNYPFEQQSNFSNLHYLGSYDVDELPFVLDGSFGLVWDGPDSKGCTGAFGNYLRINNPHKTSLYLASGFPVIVWKEAAIAQFVLNEGVGVAISSLDELDSALSRVSKDEYSNLLRNVQRVSERMRCGYYTEKALSNCF